MSGNGLLFGEYWRYVVFLFLFSISPGFCLMMRCCDSSAMREIFCYQIGSLGFHLGEKRRRWG